MLCCFPLRFHQNWTHFDAEAGHCSIKPFGPRRSFEALPGAPFDKVLATTKKSVLVPSKTGVLDRYCIFLCAVCNPIQSVRLPAVSYSTFGD